MPVFSRLNPFPVAFSHRPSTTEQVYREVRDSVGAAFDLDTPGFDAAHFYAHARAIARAKSTLRRAAISADPVRATVELLENHEADYGIVTSGGLRPHQRRARLAVAASLPLGGNLANIFATLSAALGTRFLGLRVLTPAEATVVPSSPTAGAGVYASRARPRVALKLVDPIAWNGGAQWVDCVPLSPLEFPDLPQANTKAVLEPDVDGLAETVTILGARRSGSVIQLEIENLRPHGAGAPLVTGPSPLQWSTKRTYLVAIKMALGEERYATQVHEIMRRLVRGVSTWRILALSTDPGTAPALALASSRVGFTALGAWSYR